MNAIIIGILSVAALGFVAEMRKMMAARSDANLDNQELDAEKQKQFGGMMQDGENLLVVCPATRSRKYYWAVTDRRLLIEGKQGLSDVPRSSIKKVVGYDHGGKKCTRPEQLMYLRVFADKKYYIDDGSASFTAVARELSLYLQK